MNYLRGAFNAASQYYKDLPPINPSTLTGAIDVIVVEHRKEDGEIELACTPFHVRFGKWQVLRPGEKKVNVKVNGQSVPFNMKIGDAGEAFFVFQTDDDVPEDLITSPILSATHSSTSQENGDLDNDEHSQIEKTSSELNRRRDTKDADPEPLDLDKPMSPDQLSSRLSSISLTRPNSDDNESTSTYAALRPSNILNQTVNPGKAAVYTVFDHDHSQFRLIDKTEAAENHIRQQLHEDKRIRISEAKGDEALSELKDGEGDPPPVIFTKGAALDMVGYHPQIDISSKTVKAGSLIKTEKDILPTNGSVDPANDIQITPRFNQHDKDVYPTRATSEPPEISPSSSPQYSWDWGAFPQRTPVQEKVSAYDYLDLYRSVSVPPELENDRTPALFTSVNTEVATLHMSHGQEVELNVNVNENDGTQFLLRVGDRTYEFELSICGELSDGRDEVENAKCFRRHQISYRHFMKSPTIVDDDNLVMLWNDRYITTRDDSPLMTSLSAWRRAALTKRRTMKDAKDAPISSSDERESLQRSTSQMLPKRTSSTWVRWWKPMRYEPVQSEKLTITDRPAISLGSSSSYKNESRAQTFVSSPDFRQALKTSSFAMKTKRYAKTLRLTSDQLKALDLKHGSNLITFSLSTSGAVACHAHIFVWQSTDQIVVSDIDGTITKSDALGHVLTMIGRDWTHLGVAKLYTDIRRNGYKIMYLTSRAIGQADSTREYLKGIKQNNYQLPEGPVIMSPDRLLASLHREVIMRKPELFKTACLRDIQRLFSTISRNPFYAGFGNRMADALSYRSVNIPSARIFTIDSSGEVKMELLELAGYKSSYIHMTDLVDQMFPPINRNWTPEFTDFNYWKQPIQEYPLPDLSPPSPTLSALSDNSTFSRIRNFSLGKQSPLQITSSSPVQKVHADDTETELRKVSSFEYVRERLLGSIEVPETSSRTALAVLETQKEQKAERRLSTDSIPVSLSDVSLFQDGESRFGDNDDDSENVAYFEEDGFEDEAEAAEQAFDDNLFATGEMQNVPFL